MFALPRSYKRPPNHLLSPGRQAVSPGNFDRLQFPGGIRPGRYGLRRKVDRLRYSEAAAVVPAVREAKLPGTSTDGSKSEPRKSWEQTTRISTSRLAETAASPARTSSAGKEQLPGCCALPRDLERAPARLDRLLQLQHSPAFAWLPLQLTSSAESRLRSSPAHKLHEARASS